KHAPGIAMQHMSGMGKNNAPPMSFNQFKSYLVFQALNDLCDGGLTENQFLRCPCDVFMLSYRLKNAQMIEIHAILPIAELFYTLSIIITHWNVINNLRE